MSTVSTDTTTVSKKLPAPTGLKVEKNAEGHYVASFTLPMAADGFLIELKNASIPKDKGMAPTIWMGEGIFASPTESETPQELDLTAKMAEEKVPDFVENHEIIINVTPYRKHAEGVHEGEVAAGMFRIDPAPASATTEPAPVTEAGPVTETVPETASSAAEGAAPSHQVRDRRVAQGFGTAVLPEAATVNDPLATASVPAPILERVDRFGHLDNRGHSLKIKVDPSKVTRFTVVGHNPDGKIVFPLWKFDVREPNAKAANSDPEIGLFRAEGVTFGPVRKLINEARPGEAELNPEGDEITFSAQAFNGKDESSEVRTLVWNFTQDHVTHLMARIRSRNERAQARQRNEEERRRIEEERRRLESEREQSRQAQQEQGSEIEELRKKIEALEKALQGAASKAEVNKIKEQLKGLEDDLDKKFEELGKTLQGAATKDEVSKVRDQLKKLEDSLAEKFEKLPDELMEGLRGTLDEKFAALTKDINARLTEKTPPAEPKKSDDKGGKGKDPKGPTPAPAAAADHEEGERAETQRASRDPRKIEVKVKGSKMNWGLIGLIASIILLIIALIAAGTMGWLAWLRETPAVVTIPVDPNRAYLQPQVAPPATPTTPAAVVPAVTIDRSVVRRRSVQSDTKTVDNFQKPETAKVVANEPVIEDLNTVAGEYAPQPAVQHAFTSVPASQPYREPAPQYMAPVVTTTIPTGIPVQAHVNYSASFGNYQSGSYSTPPPIPVTRVQTRRGSGYVLTESPAFGVAPDLVHGGNGFTVVRDTTHRGNNRGLRW